MSLFKKTCFECGGKVDKLYDGICVKCVKEQIPPISELKPLNFKVCNSTKKICWNNYYYTHDEIENLLPEIVKKNLIINKEYELIDILIENFEIEGNKVIFDLEVNCNLRK